MPGQIFTQVPGIGEKLAQRIILHTSLWLTCDTTAERANNNTEYRYDQGHNESHWHRIGQI